MRFTARFSIKSEFSFFYILNYKYSKPTLDVRRGDEPHNRDSCFSFRAGATI